MSTVYPRPAQAVRAWLRPSRLAMLAILLSAFALRALRLDYQSLWSDEGISILRASQPLDEMLRNMPLEHTPLYFVLLHGWLSLAGTSDVALRYFSLLPSVLAVALIYRLGMALGAPHIDGPQAQTARLVAVTAALLLATGGFQVWYAQEGRMYSWLLAAALVSCLSQWQVLEGKTKRQASLHPRDGSSPQPEPGQARANWWAILYALSTAAVVYLHLFGALLPLAQAIFALCWLFVRRDWRPFVRWALAALGALLLFLPWLPRVLGIFGFEGWRDGGDASLLPWRYWQAYTVGDGLAEPWRAWLPWLYAALAAGGVVYWWRRRTLAAAYLLLILLGPGAAVLALAIRNPDYHERYTIYLAAPLLLLAAGGIGLLDLRPYFAGRQTANATPPSSPHNQVRRKRNGVFAATAPLLPALLVAGILVAANGAALQRQYTDASLHKPDYRAAAARIAADLRPGDVVLVDGPDPEKVFQHYFASQNTVEAPVYAVGHLQNAAYDAVGAELRPLLQNAGRVWELLYFHPPAAVQVWLATQAWATDPSEHNGVRVVLYGLPTEQPTEQPTVQPLDVTYRTALTLNQAEIAPAAPQPGDLLRITTRWFVHEPLPEYKFSLRLADGEGSTVYTVDYVPQNWFAPTNVWVVGQPAADQRGIPLPADLPHGVYTLTLRLYDPATGAAAESSAGQDVLLGEIEIGGPQP